MSAGTLFSITIPAGTFCLIMAFYVYSHGAIPIANKDREPAQRFWIYSTALLLACFLLFTPPMLFRQEVIEVLIRITSSSKSSGLDLALGVMALVLSLVMFVIVSVANSTLEQLATAKEKLNDDLLNMQKFRDGVDRDLENESNEMKQAVADMHVSMALMKAVIGSVAEVQAAKLNVSDDGQEFRYALHSNLIAQRPWTAFDGLVECIFIGVNDTNGKYSYIVTDEEIGLLKELQKKSDNIVTNGRYISDVSKNRIVCIMDKLGHL